MAHAQDCRFSPLYPHCNCGESERDEHVEKLERRILELEYAVDMLNTCDTCCNPATRHVCRHHCFRD